METDVISSKGSLSSINGVKLRDFPAELLYSVFEMLGPKDMASASLVCRRWCEIATTVKWSTLEVHFSHLGILMLAMHAKIDIALESTSEPPTAERLRWLASMVTRLRVDGCPSTIKQLDLYKRLSGKEASLCTNVKSLVVDYRQESVLACRLLVGGSLKSAELQRPAGWGWNECTETSCGLIAQLVTSAPNLRHLAVDYPFRGEIPLIASFGQLRSLDFDGFFSLSVWKALATQCPLLEDIKLAGWDDTDEDFTDDPPEDLATFHSLRTIDLTSIDNDPVGLGLMRSSTTPQLRSFSLSIDFDRYGILIFDYLQPLVRRSPLLETLRLEVSELPNPAPTDDPALGPIENLDSFSHLTSLIIVPSCFDEGRLRAMHHMIPRKLPSLKHLVLLRRNEFVEEPFTDPPGGWSQSGGIEIADLQHLVPKVTALQSLDVILDATTIPPNYDSKYQALGVQSLSLRPIFLQHLQIKYVAKVLHGLFPNVTTLEGTAYHLGEGCEYMDGNDNVGGDEEEMCPLAFQELKEAFFACLPESVGS